MKATMNEAFFVFLTLILQVHTQYMGFWIYTAASAQEINPLLRRLSTESLMICSMGMNSRPKSISFLDASLALSNPGWVSFGNLFETHKVSFLWNPSKF